MFTRAGKASRHTVMLYVGEGSDREQWCLFHSLMVFSHSLCYPQSNWALLMMLPEWMGSCVFWDPVGLSNEFSCEAGSFSTPTGVFNQWFEALFPHAGTVGCAVYGWVHQLLPCCQLQLCPPCSTIRHLAGSASHHLAESPLCLAARLHPSYWSG